MAKPQLSLWRGTPCLRRRAEWKVGSWLLRARGAHGSDVPHTVLTPCTGSHHRPGGCTRNREATRLCGANPTDEGSHCRWDQGVVKMTSTSVCSRTWVRHQRVSLFLTVWEWQPNLYPHDDPCFSFPGLLVVPVRSRKVGVSRSPRGPWVSWMGPKSF